MMDEIGKFAAIIAMVCGATLILDALTGVAHDPFFQGIAGLMMIMVSGYCLRLFR